MRDIYKDWEENGELDNILVLVRKWREDGAGTEEIAKKLGISKSSFFKYQAEHSEFAEALKKGKEVLDAEVENSLKKECIGYYYEETTTTTDAIIDKRTGQITDLQKVETKTVKRYARPSMSAIAYYLNNRLPDRWRNRIVTVVEDPTGIDESMKEMEDYFAKELAKKRGNDS